MLGNRIFLLGSAPAPLFLLLGIRSSAMQLR